MAEAQRFVSGAPSQQDDEMASIQAMMNRQLAGIPIQESLPRRAPISLPFVGPVGSVGGPIASAIRGLSNVREEVSIPLFLATAGAAMAPASAGAGLAAALPRAAGLLRPLARVAPQMLGAGAGGAVAGGGMEAERGGSAEDIARAALSTGATMAGAELAGLGAVGLGSTLLAPARTFPILRHADPFKPIREAVRRFSREAPARTREAIRAAEAAAPGTGAALRAAAERLRDITARVTEGGQVSTRRLREEWMRLSIEQRGMFGSFERFASGVSRIATRTARLSKTTAGQELLEMTAVPMVTTIFGPAAGVMLWGLKQSIAPGPLMRYFSRESLPGGPVTQTLTGQTTRMTPRAIAATDLAEEQ